MKLLQITGIPQAPVSNEQLVEQWQESFGAVCKMTFCAPQQQKFQFKRKTVTVSANGFWAHADLKGNEQLVAEDDQKHLKEMDELAQEMQGLQVPKFDDLYEADESPEMHELDPLKWMKQDHYGILGLGKMRYHATDEDIKRAYRLKVLKHHPDKHAQAQSGQKKDSYFKCIQKAYEWLTDPVQRRQFDSVDPDFDDSVPSAASKNFFEVFGAAFARNSHFSRKHPVPQLGDMDTPREQVEKFYLFWSNFDSWRSFELMDEEPTGDIENRDERRWTEKKNKAARIKYKKEDMARLVKLIDSAIKSDPRMQLYKEQDAAAKKAKKHERGREAREAEEAARALVEQARKAEEDAALAVKKQAADAKEQRELRKKEVKSQRRAIRSLCTDKYELFAEMHPDLDVHETAEKMIVEFADDLDLLTSFVGALTDAPDCQAAWAVFTAEYARQNVAFKQEDEQARLAKLAEQRKSSPAVEKKVAREWSPAELTQLVKAVNLIPGGTLNRWDAIARHVSKHAEAPLRDTDDVICTCNQIKKGAITPAAGGATTDTPAKTPVSSTSASSPVTNENSSWTATQQSQLESALKQFPGGGPKAYKGADRWDRIAAKVQGRNKDEVIARVKEVAKKIKSSKKK